VVKAGRGGILSCLYFTFSEAKREVIIILSLILPDGYIVVFHSFCQPFVIRSQVIGSQVRGFLLTLSLVRGFLLALSLIFHVKSDLVV